MLSYKISGTGIGLLIVGAAHGLGTRLELTVSGGTPDHYYTNTPALTATGSLTSGGPGGTASAAATVGMGEIHAQSQAYASAPIGSARSTISAQASDTVLATSLNGANVVVRWFLPVTGSGAESGVGYAHADFGFFSQSYNDNVGVNYRRYIDSGVVAYEGYFGNFGSVDYVDATYQPGQNYVVATSYDGDIRLSNGATGNLDYANTAHAYAQVLTPGATLAAASGHSYAAPVPEPATLAALGLGALAIVRGPSRRRRS